MTKDDQSTRELVDHFFDPVINAASTEELRAWLKEQPYPEIERFLNFWDWTNHRDLETIIEQEMKLMRRRKRWEEIGLDVIRDDLARGGHVWGGGTTEVRRQMREWAAEQDEIEADSIADSVTDATILQPNIFGLGLDLKKLWKNFRK